MLGISKRIEDFIVGASALPFDVEDLLELGLLKSFKLFQIFQYRADVSQP